MITFTIQPEARPVPVCTGRDIDQLRDMARRLDTRADGYRLAGEAAEAKRHRIAADTARLLAGQLEALR